MSTQNTGDGPPGDDDFYDLEDVETKKATRSSGNPNAAAWDPEKMELHRIVNWLLALEERRALAARPVEHAVPHKVKLPGFWEKNAATWFRLAEAVIEDNHVVNLQVMYRTVLLHIPHYELERGAEEQAGGATHTQNSGPVYQHPVGSRAGRPETHGAPGGDDGGPAT